MFIVIDYHLKIYKSENIIISICVFKDREKRSVENHDLISSISFWECADKKGYTCNSVII